MKINVKMSFLLALTAGANIIAPHLIIYCQHSCALCQEQYSSVKEKKKMHRKCRDKDKFYFFSEKAWGLLISIKTTLEFPIQFNSDEWGQCSIDFFFPHFLSVWNLSNKVQYPVHYICSKSLRHKRHWFLRITHVFVEKYVNLLEGWLCKRGHASSMV